MGNEIQIVDAWVYDRIEGNCWSGAIRTLGIDLSHGDSSSRIEVCEYLGGIGNQPQQGDDPDPVYGPIAWSSWGPTPGER